MVTDQKSAVCHEDMFMPTGVTAFQTAFASPALKISMCEGVSFKNPESMMFAYSILVSCMSSVCSAGTSS